MFPIGIAILGGAFGIVMGVFGAIFGVFFGLIGSVFSFIGWIFESIFGWGNHSFHFFNGNVCSVLLIILLVVALSRNRNKRQ
jgi:hypothetical protein